MIICKDNFNLSVQRISRVVELNNRLRHDAPYEQASNMTRNKVRKDAGEFARILRETILKSEKK